MSSKECIMKLSKALFWDADITQADMERHCGFIIQRVLEYGSLEDWRLIQSYFGIDRIAE